MDAKMFYCILGICWRRKPQTWAEWTYYWLRKMNEASSEETYDPIYIRTTPFIAIAWILVRALIGYLIARVRSPNKDAPEQPIANSLAQQIEEKILIETTQYQPMSQEIVNENDQEEFFDAYQMIFESSPNQEAPIAKQFDEDEMARDRNELSAKLQKCSANVETEANEDSAFQITLANPDQQILACKSRPLPFRMREKVREAIQQQLEAEIIRLSLMQKNWKKRKKRK